MRAVRDLPLLGRLSTTVSLSVVLADPKTSLVTDFFSKFFQQRLCPDVAFNKYIQILNQNRPSSLLNGMFTNIAATCENASFTVH